MRAAVSGTSSGIGRAIAEKLLAEGHSVTGFDMAEAGIAHPRYTHFVYDVRSDEFPATEPPELVIACAGTLEEADAIEVNLIGAIRFASHFKCSERLKSVLFIALLMFVHEANTQAVESIMMIILTFMRII